MTAYYNEIDPYAAQWLRNLIAAGHIAPGDVDTRSIADVRPDDLRSYRQCHFFAGIGGWSLALRLAGWPDDRPVWTGSCPCQPFSAAGAGKAADDERHLWPRWFPLIAERRPAIVFGEQVEAAIGWGWLDAVFADLETEGYACGAAVLPACGVGAPHIRARTWFVADANRQSIRGRPRGDGSAPPEVRETEDERERVWPHDRSDGAVGLMAHADGGDASAEGIQRGGEHRQQPQGGRSVRMADARYEQAGRTSSPGEAESGGPLSHFAGRGDIGRLGNASASGLSPRECAQLSGTQQFDQGRAVEQPSRSPWADLDWLPCTDGKARPVEPGTFPLAHGIPGRVGRLRAYGNAIVPQVAQAFVEAYMKGG